MSIIARFRIAANESEKSKAVARLIKASTGDFDFYLFAFLGISMATLGLALDSPEVIIGSMLIAPILYPVLSFALSLVLVDAQLVYRSLRTLGIAFLTSVGVATLLSFVLGMFMDFGLSQQLLARGQPNLLFFLVACVAGLAATYAMVHASLNEMLPGVAISVALVPPLAAVGIGLASLDLAIAGGAFLLFLINIVGILFSSVIAFSLMDLHGTRKVADSAIRQEEKRLEQEEEKIASLTNNNHIHS